MKQMVVTLSSRVPFMRSAFTVVFVAGLLIRLVALGTLGPRVTNDSQIYLAAAVALRNGGLDSFLAFQLDGRLMYSLLLAAADALLGTNLVWGVGIVQAVLGSLTAVVIGKATLGATGSKAAGLLAASIVCVHITFVFWGVYILSDTLMLLLMSVSID